MIFDLQPTLSNHLVSIRPLQSTDFEALFAAGSDPAIWAGHPDTQRYELEGFKRYFDGIMASGGAMVVFDVVTAQMIGSSTYYDLDFDNKSVGIGYTFLVKQYWGTAYNASIKTLLINHAMNFLVKVIFHIRDTNIISQKAIAKIGAIQAEPTDKSYYDGPYKEHLIYEIDKKSWQTNPLYLMTR